MNIIICGAGEVGSHVAEVLAAAGHNITVLDIDPERLRVIGDNTDVRTLLGNGAHANVLREAGGEHADLMVAATDSDEINLLCASIAKGIALIPEDRKALGTIQIMSVRENMSLASLRDFARGFHLSLAAEAGRVRDFVRELAIKVASPENPISALSGGNQQKVVIGKALMTKPKVLLMDEPSRGIDVGAKAEVYRLIHRLAEGGAAVIIVSSELPELMNLCHRIIVMSGGRVQDEMEAEEFDERRILAAAFAAHVARDNFREATQ